MASSSFPRPALQVHPTRGRRGPVGWSGLRAELKEVVGQLGQLVVVPRHPPQHPWMDLQWAGCSISYENSDFIFISLFITIIFTHCLHSLFCSLSTSARMTALYSRLFAANGFPRVLQPLLAVCCSAPLHSS